jgi:hypothetical protein
MQHDAASQHNASGKFAEVVAIAMRLLHVVHHLLVILFLMVDHGFATQATRLWHSVRGRG